METDNLYRFLETIQNVEQVTWHLYHITTIKVVGWRMISLSTKLKINQRSRYKRYRRHCKDFVLLLVKLHDDAKFAWIEWFSDLFWRKIDAIFDFSLQQTQPQDLDAKQTFEMSISRSTWYNEVGIDVQSCTSSNWWLLNILMIEIWWQSSVLQTTMGSSTTKLQQWY